jgi:hypothetical protein
MGYRKDLRVMTNVEKGCGSSGNRDLSEIEGTLVSSTKTWMKA